MVFQEFIERDTFLPLYMCAFYSFSNRNGLVIKILGIIYTVNVWDSSTPVGLTENRGGPI